MIEDCTEPPGAMLNPGDYRSGACHAVHEACTEKQEEHTMNATCERIRWTGDVVFLGKTRKYDCPSDRAVEGTW